MPRHKFIPILKSSPDGVYGICEYCGVPNNSGVLGCIPDDAQAIAPGNGVKCEILRMFV